MMMVLCCLPSIGALKLNEPASVAVEYDQGELAEFLRANVPPMNALCERGERFDQLIYKRMKAIFGYFGLPFDAPPPSEFVP